MHMRPRAIRMLSVAVALLLTFEAVGAATAPKAQASYDIKIYGYLYFYKNQGFTDSAGQLQIRCVEVLNICVDYTDLRNVQGTCSYSRLNDCIRSFKIVTYADLPMFVCVKLWADPNLRGAEEGAATGNSTTFLVGRLNSNIDRLASSISVNLQSGVYCP